MTPTCRAAVRVRVRRVPLAETRAFFAAHDYFGLGEAGVTFFEQGMLPCLTPEAKLILDQPGELAMAPNGNGGCYMSLRDAGLLKALDAEGVTCAPPPATTASLAEVSCVPVASVRGPAR